MTPRTARPSTSPADTTALRVDPLDGGSIAVVTIDRPRRGNALDSQTLVDLHRLLDAINGDSAIRVVVLTGNGSVFCAGADIKATPEDLTDGSGNAHATLMNTASSVTAVTMAAQELMASAFEKIHRLRQPVIGAINGAALGGGFALALACDIRYATPTATFGAVFIRHGVSACDMGTSYHLPRLVGASRAAELMLTGRVFGAQEACTIGLVLDLVDGDRLLEVAVCKAREIAAHSPLAVWMTKETMWQTVDSPSLRHALDIENRTQVLCASSGEIANSFAAFRDGESPNAPPL